jgi:sporulation protein YlmC with PRC-barrel domain
MNDTTTVDTSRLATDETNRLISSDKVEGTPVYNPKGQRLGKVHHLMIDKYTGQVAYAVMSFGGFLGIGEKYHPLPWKMLTYDTRMGGYVVDLDRDRIEKAPSYTARDMPDWADRAYTRRIDEYWLVAF